MGFIFGIFNDGFEFFVLVIEFIDIYVGIGIV